MHKQTVVNSFFITVTELEPY